MGKASRKKQLSKKTISLPPWEPAVPMLLPPAAKALPYDWNKRYKPAPSPDTSGKRTSYFVVVELDDFGGCADLLQACHYQWAYATYEFSFRLYIDGHPYEYRRSVEPEPSHELLEDIRRTALAEIFKVARKENRI